MDKKYGLYFHIPYCIHKCSYCDFYSLAKSKVSDDFVRALSKEIDLYISGFSQKPKIDTIFFGGGTPSLLIPNQMKQLTAKIYKNFDVADDCEFTIEANPGAIDRNNAIEYKELGVNRISMGIQSFDPDELAFLERIHSPEEAVNSFNIFRETGYDNINIDLIFAVPGQTKDSLNHTLEKAIKLQPDHISAYSLIYEPGTPLHYKIKKGKVKIQDQEEDSTLYDLLVNKLKFAGFEQYEVSNYARKDKKCRHNLKYWRSGEYFGFGPSAHSFIKNQRYGNIRKMKKYINLVNNGIKPVDNTEELSLKDKLYESLMLELRADGLDIDKFNKKFNLDILLICSTLINNMKSLELIYIENNFLKLTQKGYFLGDEISLKFISKLEKAFEEAIA